MTGDFPQLLDDFVTRCAREDGVTLEEVASRCHYSPGALRFLRRGTRRPTHRQDIMSIIKGLKLTDQEGDQLLKASGFDALSEEERLGLDLSHRLQDAFLHNEATKILEFPDNQVLAELIGNEPDVFVQAWKGYLDARAALYQRRWSEVSRLVEKDLMELYMPVRRQGARYFGYLSLLKVAAEEYRGEFQEALYTAKSALQAADIAQDRMLKIRCHVRLGDIYKFIGRFRTALGEYNSALELLGTWRDLTLSQEKWMRHWRARTYRKLATLYLFQGEAQRAEILLQTSIQDLRELESWYELSRNLYALGWSYGDQGRWEDAISAFSEGIYITEDLSERRTWRDVRQFFEGYLGLASNWLHLREYDHAKEYLDKADGLRYSSNPNAIDQALSENIKSFHEAGRLDLLLGKYYMQCPEHTDYIRAQQYLETALAFHEAERAQDPARLASIHNTLGLLYLEQGQNLKALHEFERAFFWADQSDPPVKYYTAATLVYQAKAHMMTHVSNSATNDELREIVEEARKACHAGGYWDHHARLEFFLAEHTAKHEQWAQMAEHAALAITYAIRFNRHTAIRISSSLSAILKDFPMTLRQDVINNVESVALRVGGHSEELHTAVGYVREPATSESGVVVENLA